MILTGWRDDVPRILSAIDIFVLTSLWEGLPISVLEAMATSLPVIATNTGGVAEVILEGKTGFLCVPGDVNQMAKKLTKLLEEEKLRSKIGQDAKDSLGNDFLIENMVRNTESLYWDLMKKGGQDYHN